MKAEYLKLWLCLLIIALWLYAGSLIAAEPPPETSYWCVIVGVMNEDGSASVGAQIVGVWLKREDCDKQLTHVREVMKDKPSSQVIAYGAYCLRVDLQHDKS
jgi:hypothetical protein